jgi:hypothetical protein
MQGLSENFISPLAGIKRGASNFITQEMWLPTNNGNSNKWIEAGFVYGAIGSQTSEAYRGMFWADSRFSFFNGSSFNAHPIRLALPVYKSKSWWQLQIVQQSTAQTKYHIYTHLHSKGGAEIENNTGSGVNEPPHAIRFARAGVEADCWDSATYLYGRGSPLGNGQSIKVKQSGTWQNPIGGSLISSPHNLFPAHAAWIHAHQKLSAWYSAL